LEGQTKNNKENEVPSAPGFRSSALFQQNQLFLGTPASITFRTGVERRLGLDSRLTPRYGERQRISCWCNCAVFPKNSKS
jgi:hypothetical protein